MIFAKIGHGSCYYHWNEIFAGVHDVVLQPFPESKFCLVQNEKWLFKCTDSSTAHIRQSTTT